MRQIVRISSRRHWKTFLRSWLSTDRALGRWLDLKFINRKHGREAIEFADAKLQPILQETYGIMVYQEQIMRIAQDLAGYLAR